MSKSRYLTKPLTSQATSLITKYKINPFVAWIVAVSSKLICSGEKTKEGVEETKFGCRDRSQKYWRWIHRRNKTTHVLGRSTSIHKALCPPNLSLQQIAAYCVPNFKQKTGGMGVNRNSTSSTLNFILTWIGDSDRYYLVSVQIRFDV